MEIQEVVQDLKRPTLDRKETDFFVMQKQNRKFWAFTDFRQSASKALKYFGIKN
jgi:hypothetical protein